MAAARISIVLPTYNRLSTLRRVFESYTSQEGVDELVVVDDAGTDGTEAFVREQMARNARIRYFRNPERRNLPATRNAGVDHARGDLIVFGEDDLRFGPGYAARLRDCLTRRKAAIAAGRILFPFPGESDEEALARCAGPVADRIDRRRIAFDATAPSAEDLEVPFIHAICMVKRRVFDRVRYDPAFAGNAYREETDFYLRAARAGHRIFFCPDALCVHLPREVRSLGGAMAQGIWKYKYWSLRNNRLFLNRHYADLAERGLVRDSKARLMASFAAAELRKIPSFYLRKYAPGLYRRIARRVAG